jgi:hypothetical protein
MDQGLRNSVTELGEPALLPVHHWDDPAGSDWPDFAAAYADVLGVPVENMWDWERETTFSTTGDVDSWGNPTYEVSGEIINNNLDVNATSHGICLSQGMALNSYLSSGVDYRVGNEFMDKETIWAMSYSGRAARPGECGIPKPQIQALDDEYWTSVNTPLDIDIMLNDLYSAANDVTVKHVDPQDAIGHIWHIQAPVKESDSPVSVRFIPAQDYVGDAVALYTIDDEDPEVAESVAKITIHIAADDPTTPPASTTTTPSDPESVPSGVIDAGGGIDTGVPPAPNYTEPIALVATGLVIGGCGLFLLRGLHSPGYRGKHRG